MKYFIYWDKSTTFILKYICLSTIFSFSLIYQFKTKICLSYYEFKVINFTFILKLYKFWANYNKNYLNWSLYESLHSLGIHAPSDNHVVSPFHAGNTLRNGRKIKFWINTLIILIHVTFLYLNQFIRKSFANLTIILLIINYK